MADASLGTLALGTYTNVSSTTITGSDPVLEVIASTDDADYVSDATNSSHTGTARFALDDTPSDFFSISTVAINLRYAWLSGTQVNTWDSLTARIFKSDGTTALTALTTVASSITTTSATNSGATTMASPDTSATKAEWDAAVVHLNFNISKVKSGDTIKKCVFAAEVTGTYKRTPLTVNVSDSSAVTEFVSIGAWAIETTTVTDVPTVDLNTRWQPSGFDSVVAREGVYFTVMLTLGEFVSVSIVTGFAGLSIAVSDSTTVTESITVFWVQRDAEVSDATAITESLTLDLLLFSIVSDSSTITEDTTILLAQLVPTVNEATTVTDAVVLDLLVFPTVSDSTAVTEFSHSGIEGDDIITVTESTTLDLLLFPVVSDAVAITEDTTTLLAQLVPPANDATAATDAVVLDLLLQPIVNDATAVTEFTHLGVEGDDSTAVTDDSLLNLLLFPAVFDDTTMTDFAHLGLEGDDATSVTESITISLTAAAAGLTVAVFDATALTDDATLGAWAIDPITVTDAGAPWLTSLNPTFILDTTLVTDISTIQLTALTPATSDSVTTVDWTHGGLTLYDATAVTDLTSLVIFTSLPPLTFTVTDATTLSDTAASRLPTLNFSVEDTILPLNELATAFHTEPPLEIDVDEALTATAGRLSGITVIT